MHAERKADDDQVVLLHDASKRQLAMHLVNKYQDKIDEARDEARMPEWSKDHFTNKVMDEPVSLPCTHRFERGNLLWNMFSGSGSLNKCPVPGCEQYVNATIIGVCTYVVIKPDIEGELQRTQQCYDAKYPELLHQMQEDVKAALDEAMRQGREGGK